MPIMEQQEINAYLRYFETDGSPFDLATRLVIKKENGWMMIYCEDTGAWIKVGEDDLNYAWRRVTIGA